MMHRVAMRVLCMAACGCVAVFGQANVGAIFGHVSDQSGGAVPGAVVVLLNPATNERATVVTNDRGDYIFNAVRPAAYRISAESKGFKTAVREGIILQVAEKISVEFTLEPGAVTERIEVQGDAPLLQPGTSDIGTVINQRTLIDLPLEGRNVYQLITLAPGVTPNSTYGFNTVPQSTTLSGGPGIGLNQVSINGGRNLVNEFLLDDVPNTTMGYNGVAIIPPLDAVQEFNLLTNSPSAKYGRTGGGLTTAVTKSGTNSFHGDLWEFLRNDKLDANNFFANRSGASLAPFRQNQFGGAAGGPVIHDKTFFFGSYEGFRQAVGGTYLLTVPTDLQRQGDFSQTFRSDGSLFTIFDPFTTRKDPATGGFVRNAFAGNRIPSNRFDPVAKNLLQYFPEPNLPGDAGTNTNNYLSQAGAHNSTDLFLGRVDHNLSLKQRIFARVSYDRQNFQGGNVLGNIADFNSDPFHNRHKGLTLSYTNVLSPSTILNVRYGLLREEQTNDSHSIGFDASTIGLPPSLTGQFEANMFPRFDIAGYTSLGTQYFSLVERNNTTHSLAANVSKVVGRHSIETGIDLRVIQGALFQAGWPSGQFAFDPGFTNGPDPNAGEGNGNGFASFLLGTAGAGYASYDPHWMFSQRYYAFYLQDDIKVNRRLTLNVGVRYDYESPLSDRYNQLSFVDLNADVPLNVTPVDVGLGLGLRPQPPFKGAVGFPGLNGAGKGVTEPVHTDWAPRFGFALSLTDKTVIRSAYGLMYPGTTADNSGNYPTVQGFNPFSQMVTSADGITPFNNPDRSFLLSNPFPNGLRPIVGSSLGATTSLGNDNVGFLRTDKHPYIEQWNFGVQRELPGSMLVEAAYVGSRGIHLADYAGAQFNALPDQYLALGNSLFDTVQNPFFGVLPDTSSLGSTEEISRRQLLRPYPYFGSVAGQAGHIGTSTYHGFQLKVQKRMSHGLSALLSYTNSKLIDDASTTDGGPNNSGLGGHQDFNNRRLDRTISPYNRSQVAVLSFIYELPFGRGKPLGGTLDTPVLSHLVSGWQVDSILTFATGYPLVIGCGSCSFPATRPDLVGDPNQGASGPAQQRLDRWFNVDAFAPNQPFHYGNVSRSLPNTRGPGQNNTNFSVIKDTRFAERYRLQFRAEFFNLFNRVEFGLPDSTLGSASFGVISSQVNIPRQIQFGLKFYW
jgi:hypothetical protein